MGIDEARPPRLAISGLVPLIVIAMCGAPVAGALRKLTYAILGRDQGIFQYVAWAIQTGDRDYADIHEINGPLGPIVHLVLLRLGGADEHTFRCLDVALSSVVFFLVGAVLPALGGCPAGRPRRWQQRVLWGLAGWAVLGAQYVVFGWWDTSQRESFYDLFLLVSIACQIHGSRAEGTRPTVRLLFWVLSGVLGAITWFGKPTYVVFSALQVTATVFDRNDPTPLCTRLVALASGWGGISLCMFGFIAIYGDIGAFARIVLLETPRLYGPIWHKSIAGAYWAWGNAPKLNYGFATVGALAVLATMRMLPVRLLVLPTLLVGGLITFFLQGKGFPYHLHPVSAGSRLVWIGALAVATERLSADSRWIERAIPLVGAALLGWQCLEDARLSSYVKSDWDRVGATPALRASHAYMEHFAWDDFFPWDLRSAAGFLKRTTEEADRVQLYGMDPYVLFLARRRSASPFIYSFELNVDASLEGGAGRRPGTGERDWISATARAHREQMQSVLEANPPAAFVFIDHVPFTYPPNGEIDFADHCSMTYAWMKARYRSSARFGAVRVWLRNDVYEGAVGLGAVDAGAD